MIIAAAVPYLLVDRRKIHGNASALEQQYSVLQRPKETGHHGSFLADIADVCHGCHHSVLIAGLGKCSEIYSQVHTADQNMVTINSLGT